MDWLVILHCLMSLGLGLYTLSWCFQIYQNFRFQYLSTYFYYLVAVNLYGIFAWSGKCLGGYLASHPSGQGIHQFEILFALISFPFISISIFLFICFIKNLINQSVSPAFRMIYWFFWLVIASSFLFGAQKLISSQEHTLLLGIHKGIGFFALVIRYLAIIYLLFNLHTIKNSPRQNLARWLGIYYFLAFGTYFLCTHFSPDSIQMNFVWPLLFFSLNLPPLHRLHQYVYHHHIDRYIESSIPINLNLVFMKFKISPREREIVTLMLNGKSNREIEDDLFISLGTVKNHTTNIFRKFGVGNRRQLLNTINNTFPNE